MEVLGPGDHLDPNGLVEWIIFANMGVIFVRQTNRVMRLPSQHQPIGRQDPSMQEQQGKDVTGTFVWATKFEYYTSIICSNSNKLDRLFFVDDLHDCKTRI